MRIAVLTSYTMRGMADANHEWCFCEYTWENDLFDESSELYAFKPEVVLVAMDSDHFELIFKHLPKIAESFPDSQVFVHSYFRHQERPLSFLPDHKIEECGLMSSLYHRAKTIPNVEVIDVQDVIRRLGCSAFEPKYYYLGKLCFTQTALDALREQLCQAIDLKFGKRKKCLVLDLDNTLWGGLLGDGVENLVLADDGAGKAFYDFQKVILALSESGIILAICSKNDEEQALEAIENHPYMLLRKKDFAAWRINWREKHQNIAEIAQELNIGLDSLVFLDDSDFERDSVRSVCTQVEVPNFPKDPSEYANFLCNLRLFDTFDLTEEDKRRNEMYVQERSRNAEKEAAGSYKEFLEGLDIKVHIQRSDRMVINRISQLTQRTNQFNFTGKKYAVNELNEADHVLCVHYADRVGDQGVIGAAVIHEGRLDCFVMSCRILGRGVEDLFYNKICEAYDPEIVFNTTDRNKAAQDFLSRDKENPEWIQISYSDL